MKKARAKTAEELMDWLATSHPGDTVKYWHKSPTQKGITVPESWPPRRSPTIVREVRKLFDSGEVELFQRRTALGCEYLAQRRATRPPRRACFEIKGGNWAT